MAYMLGVGEGALRRRFRWTFGASLLTEEGEEDRGSVVYSLFSDAGNGCLPLTGKKTKPESSNTSPTTALFDDQDSIC